jgi:hypothetical protein
VEGDDLVTEDVVTRGERLGNGDGPREVVSWKDWLVGVRLFCGGLTKNVPRSLSEPHWLEAASMTPVASSLKKLRLSLSAAVQSPSHLAR